MVYGAVTLLLERLRELLGEQIDLIRGAEKEVKELQKVLQRLRAFLQERKKGEAFRQFDKRIRELVYNIHDEFIEPYVTPAAPQMMLTSFNVDNLRLKIQDVRNALAEALITSAKLPRIEDQTIPLEQINVVGFEDELGILMGYLNEESEELDVISIIGESGTGKTTLASMIYEDPCIKDTFPALFWVTISQEFSTKNLFFNVVKGFNKINLTRLTESMLADIVRHTLDKTKFLMFVDGVHTTEDWSAIEVALPKMNRLGKVLLTTHNEKLACQANPKRNPHRLRSLNLDESWELLQSKVFNELDKCPPQLEIIGKDIASQCKGLPIAIVLMAGILRQKLSTSHADDEWKEISKSVDRYLSENRNASMRNIIAMSCQKLPYDLRDCFLYLGMFPKDTEIPAWKLVRLWIAEGFIEQNPRKSLEEVAENKLKDLIDRNLVVVVKTKVEGGVKTCRIYDEVRKFCISQAAFEEQNMFQNIVRYFENIKCRRICVHSNLKHFLLRKPSGPKVRSLLCSSKESPCLPPDCTESIPEAFGLLRVLDTNTIKFSEFPRKLTQLIHLRYIAVSGDKFNCLPEAVSNLWNLQTVRINTACRTFEIKADVWKMMHLRHLKTKAAIVINKTAKGKAWESLQTLSRLAAQCVTEDFCSRASNLKNLGIRGQLKILLKTNCLARLARLRKLKLVHDVYPKTPSDHPLIRLPPREAFPPNLMILELSSTFLDWKHMATLGMLPTLEVLKLKENAFMGPSWIADGQGFRYLEVLLISTTDIEMWTASGDPFPKLRSLVLKNCKNLKEIPHVLVKSLQVLDIDCCSTESLVHSANRINEEKQRMKDQPRDGFKLTISPEDEQQSLGGEETSLNMDPTQGSRDMHKIAGAVLKKIVAGLKQVVGVIPEKSRPVLLFYLSILFFSMIFQYTLTRYLLLHVNNNER